MPHREWMAADVPGLGHEGPPILTSVTYEEAWELHRLANRQKQVLEVGSAFGYSAVVMATAGAERVVAVDDHAGTTWLGDTRAAMVANLEAYEVRDRVSIMQARSAQGLATLAREGRQFGLIFIDGDHSLRGLAADIDGAVPLLADNGILAIHDYGEDCCCPDVRKFVDSILEPSYVTGTLWVQDPER